MERLIAGRGSNLKKLKSDESITLGGGNAGFLWDPFQRRVRIRVRSYLYRRLYRLVLVDVDGNPPRELLDVRAWYPRNHHHSGGLDRALVVHFWSAAVASSHVRLMARIDYPRKVGGGY
jgi:hypothetical protein